MLPDEELTQRITGAAIEVHRALEPGFLESGYGEALAVEFETTGLRFERQKTVPFQNRARKIGEQRLDFLVEGLVAVESKTVQSEAPAFFSFVRLYRKATHLASGLLLNLADLPLELERVGRESSARNPNPAPG
jgi:GxxExxY protein